MLRVRRGRIDPSPAPPLKVAAEWVPAIPRPVPVHQDRDGFAFTFLGRTVTIQSPADWTDPKHAKLWRYNAHYLDALCPTPQGSDRSLWDAWSAEQHGLPEQDLRPALIARWIADNPPSHGDGWEPYTTSLRIVNMVRYHARGGALDAAMRQSLAVQARWLAQHVEWHLLGNHLFANAKALVLSGLAFEGAEAARWLNQGAAILARELSEQALPDGGHFERSPLYHAIILEDVLDLINAFRALDRLDAPRALDDITGLVARLETAAERMVSALKIMTQPDGGPFFFNDCAFGIAPPARTLLDYAERLGVAAGSDAPHPAARASVTHLADTGYIRLEAGEATVLFDAAPVGPAYIPGHAHADTLSFELSVGADRIIVNGGTSTYERDTLRAHERSTAAHATVTVDGQDSSEVWAAFRVGRRAEAFAIRTAVEEAGAKAAARASHNGYHHLSPSSTHTRALDLDATHLTITDEVTGPQQAVARFPFAPDVSCVRHTDRTFTVTTPTRTMKLTVSAPAQVERTLWAPRFGRRIERDCLVVAFRGALKTQIAHGAPAAATTPGRLP